MAFGLGDSVVAVGTEEDQQPRLVILDEHSVRALPEFERLQAKTGHVM